MVSGMRRFIQMSASSDIKAKLGWFDISMAAVSMVIGIGIFRTPSEVAVATERVDAYFLAWGLAGLMGIIGGLVFAEIGARQPVAGGMYQLVSSAFHQVIGFMSNWVSLFFNSAAVALVAIIGAEYLAPVLLVPFLQTPAGIKVLGATMIIGLFFTQIVGISAGKTVINILSIVKVALILLFSGLALYLAATGKTSPIEGLAGGSDPRPNLLTAIGAGFVGAYFTYGGYHQTMNLGADVMNPKRNIPIGIITGTGIVFVLYMLINLGYYYTLGFSGIAAAPLVARELAAHIFGDIGELIISLTIFISVLGYLSINILHNPRIYYAMAKDRLLPPIFAKVNPRTQVQEFSLIVYCGLALGFILFAGTFGKILNYVVMNDTLMIAVMAATIFVIRKRQGKEYSGFKTPIFPLFPILFILFLLVVSVNAFLSDWIVGLISLGILITGLPIYFVIRLIFPVTDPKKKDP